MKTRKSRVIICMFLSIILGGQLFAQKGKLFKESYEAKEKIKIKLVLGDCLIKKSTDVKIIVTVNYTYDDENYEIRVREKDKSLTVQEKFYGEDAQGDSEWTIYIPENVRVDFGTATGDLTIEDASIEIDGNSGTGDINVSGSAGKFELNSGTGDVYVEGSDGEFDLNSGTGRVQIKNCSGEFEINSGTGDVQGIGLAIEDEADFNSGTGDAEVVDPKGENFDLSINSGTGDATLILNNTPLEGYFEFKTTSARGDIKCPIDFDEENEYSNDYNSYVRKSFTRGKKTPRYFISTGSGTAELKY